MMRKTQFWQQAFGRMFVAKADPVDPDISIRQLGPTAAAVKNMHVGR